MKKQLMKFGILAAFGLFLAACGNSENAAPAEEAPATEEAAPAEAAPEAAPAEGTEAGENNGGTLVQPEGGQQ